MLGAPLEMGFTISVQSNVFCKLYSSLWPTRLPTHINEQLSSLGHAPAHMELEPSP